MFGKHDCRKHGHRFEPRYDMIPPENINRLHATVDGACRITEILTKKIYVHDICTRCGLIVPRESRKVV